MLKQWIYSDLNWRLGFEHTHPEDMVLKGSCSDVNPTCCSNWFLSGISNLSPITRFWTYTSYGLNHLLYLIVSGAHGHTRISQHNVGLCDIGSHENQGRHSERFHMAANARVSCRELNRCLKVLLILDDFGLFLRPFIPGNSWSPSPRNVHGLYLILPQKRSGKGGSLTHVILGLDAYQEFATKVPFGCGSTPGDPQTPIIWYGTAIFGIWSHQQGWIVSVLKARWIIGSSLCVISSPCEFLP